MVFPYINSGQAPANMRFAFTVDSTLYCHQVHSISLAYKVGYAAVWDTLFSGLSTPAFIPEKDTLFIRWQVVADSCLNCNPCGVICVKTVSFQWQCNNAVSEFCSSCNGSALTSYSIEDCANEIIKMVRTLPAIDNAKFDNSCLNDSAGVDWEFYFTNIGTGAFDSLFVNIGERGDLLNNLTLMPLSSFTSTVKCNGCILTDSNTMRTAALCSTLVPDPIHQVAVVVKNFHAGDTLFLRFKRYDVQNMWIRYLTCLNILILFPYNR